MALLQEQASARAVLRHYRMSATKAREVLELIRNKPVQEAVVALALVNREAAEVVGKVLASAVANAATRFGLSASEVYVALAYADEGSTLKRFRPRARGRATRIRKRSCHITVVVAEMDDEMKRRSAAKQAKQQAGQRSRRVASSRRRPEEAPVAEAAALAAPEEAVEVEAVEVEAVEVEEAPVAEAPEVVVAEESSEEAAAVAGEEEGE